MKTLLLLVLLASCGKHEMPKEEDYNDSDGDNIANALEKSGIDQFTANIVPLEEIDMTLSFNDQSFSFTNKTDLQKYTKDLLVKNLDTIKMNEYFSEYNTLRPKAANNINLENEEFVTVKLSFSSIKVKPKNVYVVYSDRKVLMSPWNENLKLEISAKTLSAILKGEVYFSISNLNKYEETSISEKTYRVLINDGTETKVHYISKELHLDQILKSLNITEYKNIDEENLFLTKVKKSKSEWWLRTINNQDIVLVNESVNALSQHYFSGFDKKHSQVSRVNGYTTSVMNFPKNSSAKVFLRIRGMKKSAKIEKGIMPLIPVLGQTPTKGDCDVIHQAFNSPNESQDVEKEIIEMLALNQLETQLRSLSDSQGPYWETEVKNNATDFKLALMSLPANQYLHVGFYQECRRGIKPQPYEPNLKTPEQSLILSIEAFVEKI
jgi:hypothetical protein